MSIIDIEKMTVSERIQAMEELWDSLIKQDYEIESPSWHKDILEQRKKKIENGTADFIKLQDLKAQHRS